MRCSIEADTAARKKPDSGARLWQEFARRHRGNPFLKLDPLYALPEPLIDIIAGKGGGSEAEQVGAAPRAGPRNKKPSLIERRGVAPGFLSPAEVAFERDLARTVSGGFLRQRPFWWDLPGVPATGRPYLTTVGEDVLLAEIRGLRAGILEGEGLHPREVDALFAVEKEHETFRDLRTAAFAGWLVMSRQFREERDALRERWGGYVAGLRSFPSFPGSFVGPTTRGQGADPAPEVFVEFYGRWGIETFLTWDLPFPLRPALFHGCEYDPVARGMAGISLFVPWYYFRDGRLDLRGLANHLRKQTDMSHLGGWLPTASARRENVGGTRLRNGFVLYRYQRLAIQSRYAGRVGWDAARQDTAFAQLLGVSEESVRHVRLRLQRRLSDGGLQR